MSVLPKDYKEPSTSNYMRFEEGMNIFRILSPVIEGMEYWKTKTNDEGKETRTPIRKRMGVSIPIGDLDEDPRTGELDMPKYFWAMAVWNYNDERVQVLEITQKKIRKAIEALELSKGWGDAREYDVTVTREGKGFDTSYSVMPNPKTDLDEDILKAYDASNVNLEALFDGEDPFGGDKISDKDLEKIDKKTK